MQTAAMSVPARKRNGGGFGFIAYANSRVEKLRDEGRYDAAIKLKGYIRRFVLLPTSARMMFRSKTSTHCWYATTILG